MSQPETELTPLLKAVKYTMTFFSVGLPVALAACGALGVGESSGDVNIIFMGIYMIVFAANLFIYEALQLCPLEYLDLVYKMNFGFLYGPIGRGAYTLLIGIFAFGLSTPRPFAIGIGVALAFWGSLIITLAFVKPELFDKKEKYVP